MAQMPAGAEPDPRATPRFPVDPRRPTFLAYARVPSDRGDLAGLILAAVVFRADWTNRWWLGPNAYAGCSGRQDLAALCETSPDLITRHLKRLHRAGFLDLDHGMVVVTDAHRAARRAATKTAGSKMIRVSITELRRHGLARARYLAAVKMLGQGSGDWTDADLSYARALGWSRRGVSNHRRASEAAGLVSVEWKRGSDSLWRQVARSDQIATRSDQVATTHITQRTPPLRTSIIVRTSGTPGDASNDVSPRASLQRSEHGLPVVAHEHIDLRRLTPEQMRCPHDREAIAIAVAKAGFRRDDEVWRFDCHALCEFAVSRHASGKCDDPGALFVFMLKNRKLHQIPHWADDASEADRRSWISRTDVPTEFERAVQRRRRKLAWERGERRPNVWDFRDYLQALVEVIDERKQTTPAVDPMRLDVVDLPEHWSLTG